VAEEYATAVADNTPLLVRKARFLGLATLALYTEVFLVGLAAIVVLRS